MLQGNRSLTNVRLNFNPVYKNAAICNSKEMNLGPDASLCHNGFYDCFLIACGGHDGQLDSTPGTFPLI
jgi:hypothetical protein